MRAWLRSRRAGAAALLVVMALALSGCSWGEYTFYGDDPLHGWHQYLVVLHQKNTDDVIHHCDNNPRGSVAHAKCVLDVIHYACHAEPITGFTFSDCDQATNYASDQSCLLGPGRPENCVYSMQRSIAQVRNGSVEHLAYEHQIQGPSHQWLGQ
jgi:hypothetical protein